MVSSQGGESKGDKHWHCPPLATAASLVENQEVVTVHPIDMNTMIQLVTVRYTSTLEYTV